MYSHADDSTQPAFPKGGLRWLPCEITLGNYTAKLFLNDGRLIRSIRLGGLGDGQRNSTTSNKPALGTAKSPVHCLTYRSRRQCDTFKIATGNTEMFVTLHRKALESTLIELSDACGVTMSVGSARHASSSPGTLGDLVLRLLAGEGPCTSDSASTERRTNCLGTLQFLH